MRELLLVEQISGEPASSVALPRARGVLTAWLFDKLRGAESPRRPPARGASHEDEALALYCLYELHYRGFDDVDDRWEWDPELLGVRQTLEARFEARLRRDVGCASCDVDAREQLVEIAADATGPSLSRFLAGEGTLEQLREFAIHRSAYQLKEADPHTWAIPRLRGRAKAALVDIQYGEYGEGRPAEMHSSLFANTLRALDLDDRYGAYLERIPAVTLDTINLMSLFGLHRRWRGALLGHLALFEMTSVVPMGRYAEALRRFGLDDAATRFYDAHVVADNEHQRIALHDMVGGLLEQEPHLAPQVVFGARALTLIEGRFTRCLLETWGEGSSTLLATP